MTDSPTHPKVTIGEITDLLAWARSLTETGLTVDPAERAAFLTAKHQLLARLTDTHHHDREGEL